MTKVLAFDVGKHGGMAFKDDLSEEVHKFDFLSLWAYYMAVLDAIDLYKPDIVTCAYPTRFYRVIVFQSKLAAIIELACERRGIEFTEVQDKQAKKAIIGNGNAKKDEIMKFMQQDNEHIADALMFSRHVFNLVQSVE